MGGERDRSWRAFADLACIVAGGAVMFWIAARVDLLPRLLGTSTATNPAGHPAVGQQGTVELSNRLAKSF